VVGVGAQFKRKGFGVFIHYAFLSVEFVNSAVNCGGVSACFLRHNAGSPAGVSHQPAGAFYGIEVIEHTFQQGSFTGTGIAFQYKNLKFIALEKHTELLDGHPLAGGWGVGHVGGDGHG